MAQDERFTYRISDKAEKVIADYMKSLPGGKNSVINQMIEHLPDLNFCNSELAKENKSLKENLQEANGMIKILEEKLAKWRADQQIAMDFLGIKNLTLSSKPNPKTKKNEN